MGLPTDSYEYELLFNAARSIKGVPGMTCEIGVRQGGGSTTIIDGLLSNEDYGRTHIGIDPYGNIDYATQEGVVTKFDYTNDMRNQCMREIHAYVRHKPINFLFFPLEDTEFFTRFADGVPVYEEYKKIETQYALVHFDGPHVIAALRNEFDFFRERALHGTHFIFDDIDNYDHGIVEGWLTDAKFTTVAKGRRKAVYRLDRV